MIQFANNILRIGDEIATLAAQIDTATYRMLVLLRAFDEQDGWCLSHHSCAEWLSARTGMDAGVAREHVRVARALRDLPALSEAMRAGELSYSKVRALTRIATPENEVALLEVARDTAAAEVERIVRASRCTHASDDARRHDRRGITLHVDADGSFVLRGRLTPEQGALLQRALEKAAAALGSSEADATATQAATSAAQRTADALALVAEMALTGRASPDAAEKYQVVLHVDAESLRGNDEGMAAFENGVRVSAETSRRIACDAARIVVVHGKKGQSIDYRSRSRLVPAEMRQKLEARDRTCRFPGCKTTYCDAHHVQHWADGGPTSLDNLVLMCPKHHRLLHEQEHAAPEPGGRRRFVFVAGAPPPC